jgi:hypothetical protein
MFEAEAALMPSYQPDKVQFWQLAHRVRKLMATADGLQWLTSVKF